MHGQRQINVTSRKVNLFNLRIVKKVTQIPFDPRNSMLHTICVLLGCLSASYAHLRKKNCMNMKFCIEDLTLWSMVSKNHILVFRKEMFLICVF